MTSSIDEGNPAADGTFDDFDPTDDSGDEIDVERKRTGRTRHGRRYR